MDGGSGSVRGQSPPPPSVSPARAAHPPPPAAAATGWWRSTPDPYAGLELTPGGLPADATPLLVVINTTSGPRAGGALRAAFMRRLNPLQVVTVPASSPEPALSVFGGLPGARVLVVGGDGTVGWVLAALDRLSAETDTARAAALAAGTPPPPPFHPPPVAVLPLGTGNDLARVLGWGGGLGALRDAAGGGGLDGLLADVDASVLTLVDRWRVTVTPLDAGASGGLHASGGARLARVGQAALRRRKGKGGGGGASAPTLSLKTLAAPPTPPPTAVPTLRAATNYVGFGVDAKVALDFHAVRAAYPAWFSSQMGNRLWYTGLGAGDIVGRSARGLPDALALFCDGDRVDLPPGTEGVLLLNIASYAGGVDLWATGTGCDGDDTDCDDTATTPASSTPPPASFGDGALEIVAVYGSWHLGQLQVGLSRALRLRQCRRAVVVTSSSLAVQVDGEPWLQRPPSVFDIAASPAPARMLRRLETGPAARLAASVRDALTAAERKGVITPAQRAALETELAATMHRV